MFVFTRKATVANVANLPAAIAWAMEIDGYLNKTYNMNVKAGIQLFDTPTVHWRFEIESLDKLSELNHKLLQDKTYVAMLERVKPLWLDGGMRDEIVQYA